MTRVFRRIAAITAIAALAFAQLAVSAYACPSGSSSSSMQRATASVHHETTGCEEIVNANLCERHCDYGSSSVGFGSVSIPALPATSMAWHVAGAPDMPAKRTLDRQFLNSHPPPPLILFGVLRI